MTRSLVDVSERARRAGARALRVALLVAAVPTATPAQLISIKTVPVAEGDQFVIFPSQNFAMGGVSVAVDDPLLDPFVNPAKGTRVAGTRFFGSPVFYDVSEGGGGGGTLPLGGLVRSNGWVGGLAVAVQQLEKVRRSAVLDGPVPLSLTIPPEEPRLLSDRWGTNRYAFAMLAKGAPEHGISLGGSLFWSGLRAVDGVELLYPRSQAIKQDGQMLDARIGVLKEWEGAGSFEVLLVHNRYDVAHDVAYAEPRFDAVLRRTVFAQRIEHNVDRTNTSGLHVEYERPIGASGWRMGMLATGNYKWHPKIPNYEIMNIPRDPGRSYAFNVGAGVAKISGPAVFGLDLVYEPIWSNTWADAESPIETRSGRTIAAGARTVDNDFRFSNALLRMGIAHEVPLEGLGVRERALGFQFGLGMRYIRYSMHQRNLVDEFERDQLESWFEWSPSWGLSLRFPQFQIRYTGRHTTGVGRPGIDGGRGGRAVPEALAGGSDVLLAPSGPLTLNGASVSTHQFSVSLPLR